MANLEQYQSETRSLLHHWLTEEFNEWRGRAIEEKPSSILLIDGKMAHIQDVIDKTVMVIDRMDGKIEGTDKRWNVPTAIAVAQVHDFKRFYEGFFYGKYNKTGYLHPSEAAVKFLQDFYGGRFEGNYQKFHDEGVDPLVVYYAALHHGKKDYPSYQDAYSHVSYPGSAPADAYDAYGRLIRDADKLANAIDIEHSVKVSLRERIDEPVMSPKVLGELLAGKTVSNKYLRTGIDGLAGKLAWWSDLNYRASKEIWMEHHIFERYLAQMHTWGLQGQQYDDVRNFLAITAQNDGFTFDNDVLQTLIASSQESFVDA